MSYELTNFEFAINREIGNVQVIVKAEYDTEGASSFDFLGEYSDMNWYPKTGIYHRRSKLMYDGSKWRDKQGRFQPEPNLDRYSSNEYQFIDVGNCQFTRKDKNWLKYAFQNAEQLDSMQTEWDAIGIVAEVYYHGKLIGNSSCWGYSYHYGNRKNINEYLKDAVREQLSEAIFEAKKFVSKIVKAA